MALNITFDGFCYLNNGSASSLDIQYQAYFYKGGTASSNSKWNNVRTVEVSGYYNFNLGDGDFLTQDGTALVGARVVVVFWKNGDRTGNDCSVLEEWGAFEIVLDGSDTYTNPAQIKPNILPNLVWSMPASSTVGQTVNITNNSDDIHSWNFSGTTMYHWYTRYGETINSVNRVIRTDYDWDDGSESDNLSGAANASHSWSAPGNYTVEIVIYDVCMDTVTGTKSIEIKNNAPVPDIVMIPANPDPNAPVSFEWAGTDPQNTISGIDWVIHDSGIYGNTNTTATYVARDDTVPHSSGQGTSWYGQTATAGAFTNPGSHLVEITYYWFDGFTMQTSTYNETFTQRVFTGPTVNFTQNPDPVAVGTSVDFNNTTSDPESRVGTGTDGKKYYWLWNDDGNYDSATDVVKSYVYTNTPTTDNVDIQLCAYWNDGWEDHVSCAEKDLAIETTIVVDTIDCYYGMTIYGTSADGSVSGYQWEIYRSTASGISGPYELIWSSPVGTNQKTRTVCFTEENYFRIIGYVYGSGATTSDDDYLFVEEVCASGTDGQVEYRYVAVCPPDIDAEEIGQKSTTTRQLDKISTGSTAQIESKPKISGAEKRPITSTSAPKVTPTMGARPRFSPPSNI